MTDPATGCGGSGRITDPTMLGDAGYEAMLCPGCGDCATSPLDRLVRAAEERGVDFALWKDSSHPVPENRCEVRVGGVGDVRFIERGTTVYEAAERAADRLEACAPAPAGETEPRCVTCADTRLVNYWRATGIRPGGPFPCPDCSAPLSKERTG